MVDNLDEPNPLTKEQQEEWTREFIFPLEWTHIEFCIPAIQYAPISTWCWFGVVYYDLRLKRYRVNILHEAFLHEAKLFKELPTAIQWMIARVDSIRCGFGNPRKELKDENN